LREKRDEEEAGEARAGEEEGKFGRRERARPGGSKQREVGLLAPDAMVGFEYAPLRAFPQLDSRCFRSR